MTKRYRIAAAAHNLGRIMRLLFGIGKPRVLQAPADFIWLAQLAVTAIMRWLLIAARSWRALAPGGSRSRRADRRAAKSLS